MPNIPSALLKLNDVEVAQDAPVTEALMTKIGANINGLIDNDTSDEGNITTLQGQVSGLLAALHLQCAVGSATGNGTSNQVIYNGSGIVAAFIGSGSTIGIPTLMAVDNTTGGVLNSLAITSTQVKATVTNGQSFKYIVLFNG